MRAPLVLAAIAVLAVSLLACTKTQPTVQPQVTPPTTVSDAVVGEAATSIDSVYAGIDAPTTSEADALGNIDADLQLQ